MRRLSLIALQTGALALFVLLLREGVLNTPYVKGEAAEQPFNARFDSAQSELLLAESELLAALGQSDIDERIRRLERARGHAVASLRERPNNPHAWLFRARADWWLGEDAAALEHLRRSLATGPYERVSVIAQIDLAIRLWRDLSEAERSDIRDLILWAWTVEERDLVALANRSSDHEHQIRIAMAHEPEAMQKFERRLQRLRRVSGRVGPSGLG